MLMAWIKIKFQVAKNNIKNSSVEKFCVVLIGSKWGCLINFRSNDAAKVFSNGSVSKIWMMFLVFAFSN